MRIPSYRHHKASGQTFVRIKGRNHYLGKYGAEASHERYRRFVAELATAPIIVFLRTVKSRILFEQMLGRGTRSGEHHPDKSHFVVFDCLDGTLLEYYRFNLIDRPRSQHRSIL